VGGKLFRESLKTEVFSVAKLRLADFIKEKRSEFGVEVRVDAGKMTFGNALDIYRQRLDGDPDLKEGAKIYRRKCIVALLKSWPDLEASSVGKISKDACLAWADKFAKAYSATVYNNTVGTLRMVLEVAVEKGARSNNPARFISKRRIEQKQLRLPELEQFRRFVVSIGDGAGRWSRDCADLVQFIAYGGFRKTEAANVTWADCDLQRKEIKLRVTKNGEPRSVAMIPEMEALLVRMRSGRKAETGESTIMRVHECQKAMDRAATEVGMQRITHHDLRHLFATRCIESGVDIPTVARWLGHKDGGALAMRVYGHLRNQHSQEMAAKVKF
jgi:integrase